MSAMVPLNPLVEDVSSFCTETNLLEESTGNNENNQIDLKEADVNSEIENSGSYLLELQDFLASSISFVEQFSSNFIRKFMKICLYLLKNIEEITTLPENHVLSTNEIKESLFESKMLPLMERLHVEDEKTISFFCTAVPSLYHDLLKRCPGDIVEKELSFHDILSKFIEDIKSGIEKKLDRERLVSESNKVQDSNHGNEQNYEERLPKVFRKFIKMCLYVMMNIEEFLNSTEGKSCLESFDIPQIQMNDFKVTLFEEKLSQIYRKLRIQDDTLISSLNEAIPLLYSDMLQRCPGDVAEKELLFHRMLDKFAHEVMHFVTNKRE